MFFAYEYINTRYSIYNSVNAMTMNSNSDSQIIFPGEILGNELEVIPGIGTKNINGLIHSLFVGKSEIKEKKANVHPKKVLAKIVPFSDVIGVVVDIIEPIAIVAIKPLGKHVVDKGDVGILHVSNCSEKFLPSIKEAVRVGDIILAKTIEIDKSIQISIKGQKYGVISAYSRLKKTPMIKIGYDKIKCPRTNSIEKRKLSVYYGKHEEVLKWLKK